MPDDSIGILCLNIDAVVFVIEIDLTERDVAVQLRFARYVVEVRCVGLRRIIGREGDAVFRGPDLAPFSARYLMRFAGAAHRDRRAFRQRIPHDKIGVPLMEVHQVNHRRSAHVQSTVRGAFPVVCNAAIRQICSGAERLLVVPDVAVRKPGKGDHGHVVVLERRPLRNELFASAHSVSKDLRSSPHRAVIQFDGLSAFDSVLAIPGAVQNDIPADELDAVVQIDHPVR